MFGLSTLMAAILLQSASEPQGSPASAKIIDLGKEYHACLTLSTITFEKAKEPASDTVDAIFASCWNERAALVLKFLESRQVKNPDYPLEDAEFYVDKIWGEDKRREILVQLFEERSGYKK